jgi:hypothetical protein
MRRAVLLLSVFATTALLAAPAGAQAAERPWPEIPPVYCDPGPCFPQLEGARECISNGVAAVVDALEGTPQPRECNPAPSTQRSAGAAWPPKQCDPHACPDPVNGAEDCANAVLAHLRGEPLACDPIYGD